MNIALLTFSNGEKLELPENQLIIPLVKDTVNDEIIVSQGHIYTLWYHSGAGLIPSVCEILCQCVFFQLPSNLDKVYNSAAVVTVENL